ncbi:MAG: hypothetical protein ABH828_05570 [archaeon]
MATFLDIGILKDFSIVFVFLLVFVVIYAFLEYSNIFGQGRKGINGIIALAIGILIVISRPAVLLIHNITPWFMILFIFIFFVIFAIRMFGVSESDTISMIKDQRVYMWLVVIFIVILIAGLSSTFGQLLLEKGTGIEGTTSENGTVVIIPGDIESGSTQTTSFGGNVLSTLVHPKVLGLIAILLIGLFSIVFLTKLT